MSRKVHPKELKFIQEELSYYQEKEFIHKDQVEKILAEYQVTGGLNFIRIILLIGGVLIGLGILSFIASNWQALGKITKLLLICTSYISANIISHKFEASSSKLSESFRIIGVAIYGAGIFLIGQMFNFGGHFTTAFLLWSIGILPMAYFLKDRFIYLFSILLLFAYANGLLSLGTFPWLMFPILIGLYYLNQYFGDWNLSLFIINLLSLNTVALFITHPSIPLIEDYFGVIFFVLGLLMYYLPFQKNRFIFKLQGNLVFGIAGIFLTFEDAWNFLGAETAPVISLVFALLFTLYLLFLVRQENLIALAFVCITIFRYYADTMYDFMPKSLFFISCGLLLLGFGYYVERKRRKSGGILND